jgi:DNA-binding MarR family transcriptional regulator
MYIFLFELNNKSAFVVYTAVNLKYNHTTMGVDRTDELLTSIRKIIRAVDLHSKVLLKKYGLTGPQLMILHEIGNSNELIVTEIAKHISLSQATVTTILDRLEQQGFINRKRGQSDKRKVYIEASDKTQAILASKPSLLQADFIDRFNRLEDWEQTLLLSSLQRIASMMEVEKLTVESLLVGESL